MGNSDLMVIDWNLLVEYCIYVGPHLIAGDGFQAAFDFGSTQASVFCGPDSECLELMAFGDLQVQVQGLDAAKAFEMLMGMAAAPSVLRTSPPNTASRIFGGETR